MRTVRQETLYNGSVVQLVEHKVMEVTRCAFCRRIHLYHFGIGVRILSVSQPVTFHVKHQDIYEINPS